MISSPVTPIASDNLFVLTAIKMNLEFPDCYVCKLAPVFEDNKSISTNYDNSNTNFLKVDI